MRIVKFGIFVLFCAICVAACSANNFVNSVNNAQAEARPATPLPTPTIDELALGRKVFEQNCAICHKPDGTGGKVEIEGKTLEPEDLTSEKIESFSDEKIIRYIINGIEDEGMPAFKGKLSEGEIRDVVKFIRTQFHKK